MTKIAGRHKAGFAVGLLGAQAIAEYEKLEQREQLEPSKPGAT